MPPPEPVPSELESRNPLTRAIDRLRSFQAIGDAELQTRWYVRALIAAILGVLALFLLPTLWPHIPPWLHFFIAIGLSCAPIIFPLAQLTARPSYLLGGPLLVLLLFPAINSAFHPEVLLLNLGDEVLEIQIDEFTSYQLMPMAYENAGSGLLVHWPSGTRRVRIRSASRADAEEIVLHLKPSQDYVFAPMPHDRCFWMEVDHFGRSGQFQDIAHITPKKGLFELSVRPDSWFAPNRLPAWNNHRSSGGVMNALRFAPCAERPRAGRTQ